MQPPSMLFLPLLILLLSIWTVVGRRIGPEVYVPDCKEGERQKQKDVRACCHAFGIRKLCRRLCSTNRYNHVFKGALSCGFKYQHIVDACHCGLEPVDPKPRNEHEKREGEIEYGVDVIKKRPGGEIRKVNITIAALRSGSSILSQQLFSTLPLIIMTSTLCLLTH